MLNIIARITSQHINDDKITKIIHEHKNHILKHIIKNIQLINYVFANSQTFLNYIFILHKFS